MYKTFSEGLLGSNTYLLFSKTGGEGMVIDCGNEARRVFDYARSEHITVKYILLTHAHFDHADFLAEYKRLFPNAKLLASEREVCVMTDAEANVSALFGTPRNYGYPDLLLKAGDVIHLGDDEYEVLLTPGHTPGSICLYDRRAKLMFTGDTLFAGGRGRCDFKFGSEEQMAQSLQLLLSLDGETVFLPGHGQASTIASERGRVF